MTTPFDSSYFPPAPVLSVRLAGLGEAPLDEPLWALVDTGADGTLVPSQLLRRTEATVIGRARLYGVLGEWREVRLFEVDLHVGSLVLPGMTVIADDAAREIVLGRNVLNKLILLLDGPRAESELFEQRPRLLHWQPSR